MNHASFKNSIGKYLWVFLWLCSISALAQAPPNFTTSIGRTACGGSITVDWNADASILRDYWAKLYNSAGVELSQQAFDLTQKKARFTYLSAGNYTVKVMKKDGTTGYGGTSPRVHVTSNYTRFSIDATTGITQTASSDCSATGQANIKVKNGKGPFVIKAYERGSSTASVTSAVTAKSGTETPVLLSGLKPNVVYDIEVTDQMGNQGCSLTEPKTTRSITTLPASGSFVRNLSMETCRPLKYTETVWANGL